MSEEQTVTVSLQRPVIHDDTTYTELTFSEPDVGILMAADSAASDFSSEMVILALMCGLSLPAFKKVKRRDLSRIMEDTRKLVGNEPNTPKTGATLSG